LRRDPHGSVEQIQHVGPVDFPDREFHLKRLEAGGLINAAARTIPLALFALGAIYKRATTALLILGALAGTMQVDQAIGTASPVQIVSRAPDHFCIQNRRFSTLCGVSGSQPGHAFPTLDGF
jgi:hypothetical protein